MEVEEETAQHFLVIDRETFYFCSEHCKARFSQEVGRKEPMASSKGFVGRLLEKIARSTEKSYGKKPPQCH
jgi:hypothetical protein